ncbi:hypothetical protein B1A91_11390 [Neisseria meningitidis]|nr:hypothetical protein B1A91_11390 [Neisseria meningitidis]
MLIGRLKPTLRLQKIPSFPRRRESRPFGAETYRIKNDFPCILDSHFHGNEGYRFPYGRVQIPAFAGMTAEKFLSFR